jgi:hypothetical protein
MITSANSIRIEKTIAGKKNIDPTPINTPMLKIAEPGCELLYKFSIRYQTHIISELISKGAEKKFHDGNKEVTNRNDMPGRKFAFPNNLW